MAARTASSGVNVLVLTAFLLFGGLLGDLFGRRRILLVGTTIAVVANLLCTLGSGPAWFVVFRGLEGFGSALAFPMTLAIIQGSFNGRGRVIALLLYTLTAALAAITSLSALALTTLFDWRASLIMPIVAGTMGLVLAWRYTPESRSGTRTDLHHGIVITGWSLILLAVTLGLLTSRQTSSSDQPGNPGRDRLRCARRPVAALRSTIGRPSYRADRDSTGTSDMR